MIFFSLKLSGSTPACALPLLPALLRFKFKNFPIPPRFPSGSVYDLISTESNKDERKKLARKTRRRSKTSVDEAQILLKGYLLKQGGAFGRAWRRRFVVLSNDTLMWGAEEGAPASKSLALGDIESVGALEHTRKGHYIRIVAKSRELDLMAEVRTGADDGSASGI